MKNYNGCLTSPNCYVLITLKKKIDIEKILIFTDMEHLLS